MGSVSELLQQAGYKKEKSTSGEKPILEGIYKATLVEVAKIEDKGYGEAIYAQFKINEVLHGMQSKSQYPEFKDYYSLAPDKIASKRSGLAKLLNGLFSVGIEADPDKLEDQKGAEVFIAAYKQKKMSKNDDGSFAELEGEYKQGYTFMTEANAVKEAKKKGGFLG